MVLAGPGTGKTQVLAMRVANILLKTQMDPWNILCLTFTESGVAAMRSRLIDIIGEAAYAVRIHTFHSFCNDVIQEFPEKFTTYLSSAEKPNLSLSRIETLSDTERVELVRAIIDDLPATHPLKPFGQPYLLLADILDAIKKLKQEGISSEKYQKVLDAIADFTKQADSLLKEFFALTPKERSERQCQNVYEQLGTLAKATGVDQSIWWPAERLFKHHFAGATDSSEKREQSKRRTKLKSDLQRWYRTVSNPLPKQQGLRLIHDRYQQLLRERGRYDYEDMVGAVIDRFQTDDDLLARYQEQFQYVLVDEYQDTNSAQNEAIRLLGSFTEKPNICVVGDDKQSIYRFQGASLENLLYFHELYKDGMTIVSLTDNYRSHQLILDAAAAVISHNEESVGHYLPKIVAGLQARSEVPARPIEVIPQETEETEDFFIVRTIQSLLVQGVDPSQIAVMYRYHRDGEGLLDVMLRLKVPVRREGRENILEDYRIQQLVTLLTYMAYPEKSDLLVKIIQYDFWGLLPLDVVRVIQVAGQKRQAVFTVMTSLELLAEAKVEKPQTWVDLGKKLATWKQVSSNRSLPDFFDLVLQDSGFLRSLTGQAGDVIRLNKLTTLFQELKRLCRHQPKFFLADFIHHLELLSTYRLPLTAQELHTKKRAVRLLTAHKAKGLEFDYVFIMRLKDRHWGNTRERNRLPMPQGLLRHDRVLAQENNEDERRLFYVALTRARRQLYLTYALHDEQGKERVPSLFLQELLPEQVQIKTAVETEDEAAERIQVLSLTPITPPSDEISHWVKGLLDQYALSVTHLNDYLECPRKFYWRDLLRVPEATTKQLAFGRAVHQALRDFFSAFTPKQPLPPLAFLLERFAVQLEQEQLTDGDLRDSLTIGQKALSAYFEHQKALFQPSLWLEYSFASHGVRVDDIPITGQLDKIEWVNQGRKTVRVIDYKTGNPDRARKELQPKGKYYRQLAFYQLLCDRSARFPYTMVQGRVDFIEPSHASGECLIKEFSIGQKDVKELQATIRQVWQDIQALKFLQPESGCGECRYCRLGKQHS